MSKSWRERISEARERGSFNAEDWEMWNSSQTCLIGEVAGRIGWNSIHKLRFFFPEEEAVGLGLQGPIYRMLKRDDFDGLDDLMDRLDDAALAIKREAQP